MVATPAQWISGAGEAWKLSGNQRRCGAVTVDIVQVIRCNESGEVREVPGEAHFYLDDDPSEPNSFWWSDGNEACDCNRELFWLGDQDCDEDTECSHGRYSIKLMNAASRRVFYSDFAEDGE